MGTYESTERAKRILGVWLFGLRFEVPHTGASSRSPRARRHHSTPRVFQFNAVIGKTPRMPHPAVMVLTISACCSVDGINEK